jgi:hypothetical protein
MTVDEATQLIREALAMESSAVRLSNRLFSPEGLFRWLADDDNARKELVVSPLFQQAQRRVRELQYQEAAAFGERLRRAAPANGSQNPGENTPSK